MRLHKLLIAIALCLCLSVVVSAHPGSTHPDGGHFNRSTGEYHYHHGYPAHEHSDMDGDGNLDCPYLFDDKTNSLGNEIESPSNKTETSSNKTESSKDDTEPVKNGNSKNKKDYTLLLTFISCIAIYGLPMLASVIQQRLKK